MIKKYFEKNENVREIFENFKKFQKKIRKIFKIFNEKQIAEKIIQYIIQKISVAEYTTRFIKQINVTE